jgi:glycogen operon protein
VTAAGHRLGARPEADGWRFNVRSQDATDLWLCLFDAEEEQRLAMSRNGDDLFTLHVPSLAPGALYGLRADGPYDPEAGLWFDPNKLLVEPYALELDRRFVHDPRLALPRGSSVDTADLVPKARLCRPQAAQIAPPRLPPDGLIYEVNVKGFTRLHPEVPEHQRGTVAALAHPAIIAHLKKLRVSAVELMPITAWIDERHLPPLALANAWGYNPVALMALDPGLAPGGIAELRQTVATLHEAGIGVILDLVFNHTGESDVLGPSLSLRGLDNRHYYAHEPDAPGRLINDTGCGNTLACHLPRVRELVLDTLRHFVAFAAVDGFRFDLAPVLARTPQGFDPQAAIFSLIAEDAVLADRIMIAEPWDCGPGGYQLGQFPPNFLEWNDRYRDDVRRFWRGDPGACGDLATRIAGSSDIFGRRGESRTRSVNFLAAHDGFTLKDLVSFEHRHNLANGEDNRDGHGENLSWNNGVEGPTDDPQVEGHRALDLRALLTTLFASRGVIMLTAGDAFGRSQGGNNNAYAQDNPVTWIDWAARDLALEDFTADLARFRAEHPELGSPVFLDKDGALQGVEWRKLDGGHILPHEWQGLRGLELRLTLASGKILSLRLDQDARAAQLSAHPQD